MGARRATGNSRVVPLVRPSSVLPVLDGCGRNEDVGFETRVPGGFFEIVLAHRPVPADPERECRYARSPPSAGEL